MKTLTCIFVTTWFLSILTIDLLIYYNFIEEISLNSTLDYGCIVGVFASILWYVVDIIRSFVKNMNRIQEREDG